MFVPDVQPTGGRGLCHRPPSEGSTHHSWGALFCQCPNEKSRTAFVTICPREITLFPLSEQYKLLSDHIEQMAIE